MFPFSGNKPVIVNQGITPNAPAIPMPQPAIAVNTPVSTPPNGASFPAQIPPAVPPSSAPPGVMHIRHTNKFFFLIPVVIVLVTMVAITAILPSLKRSDSAVVVPSPEPSLVPATPVPTPQVDQKATWKSYVNKAVLLGFKYPKELSLIEGKEKGSLPENRIVLTVPEKAQEGGSIVIIIAKKELRNQILETYTVKKEDIQLMSEGELQIAGMAGIRVSGKVTQVDKLVDYQYGYIEHDQYVYVFEYLGAEALPKVTFDDIMGTVRFLSPGVTADWQTYSNSLGGYSLSYPPAWNLAVSNEKATGSAQTISIRKNPEEAAFQNFVIQVSSATPNKSADLSASEIISSIQNLSGWREIPSLDFRTIGGGQAQIISGEKDGAWHQYAVLWYKNTLIETSWRDTLFRPEQETFDDMLGSFKFTK